MKKNIAIIILSVCLAALMIIAAVMGLSLRQLQGEKKEAARLAERVWAEYMSWHDYIGYDSGFNSDTDESRYPSASIRCIHSEAFDLSVPDPEGTEVFTPGGNYIYDIYIYDDGSGMLSYQQWGEAKTETENDGWTYAPICFHKSETPLTAEEVQSVLTVMEQHDYENIPTQNPDMYNTLDASPTFVHFTCSVNHDRASWRDHLVTEYSAEEGSPCYDIRKAIEALVIAHDAGPVPVSAVGAE